RPETGLQGQVPAPERASPGGFKGFSCNLELIAQVKDEGASWQTAEMREANSFIGKIRSRKACAYHNTASPSSSASRPGSTNFGPRVVDISDPAKPVLTAYLTTPAMNYPHESLKVNEKRKLLGAVRGLDVAPYSGGPEFDVYDVSGDCAHPQLLASVALQAPE